MAVAAYITYHLLNLEGAGYTPVHQVQQMGMQFSGGLWKQGEVYFGYLIGDVTKVDDTINALSPWRIRQLTESEALAWSEAAVPINTTTEEGEYIGPAEIDDDGYIMRPLSKDPWEI